MGTLQFSPHCQLCLSHFRTAGDSYKGALPSFPRIVFFRSRLTGVLRPWLHSDAHSFFSHFRACRFHLTVTCVAPGAFASRLRGPPPYTSPFNLQLGHRRQLPCHSVSLPYRRDPHDPRHYRCGFFRHLPPRFSALYPAFAVHLAVPSVPLPDFVHPFFPSLLVSTHLLLHSPRIPLLLSDKPRHVISFRTCSCDVFYFNG